MLIFLFPESFWPFVRSVAFVEVKDPVNFGVIDVLPPSRMVELRFFGGLSLEETADVMGVSIPTVSREMRLAQAWLHREMAK